MGYTTVSDIDKNLQKPKIGLAVWEAVTEICVFIMLPGSHLQPIITCIYLRTGPEYCRALTKILYLCSYEILVYYMIIYSIEQNLAYQVVCRPPVIKTSILQICQQLV